MKLVCNRAALVNALSITAKVVPARTAKPVLACVHLSAGQDSLTVSATDLEVSVRLAVGQVQVSRAGVAVVHAGHLLDIARSSIDESLSMELTGDMLEVGGEDALFKVYTQPEDSFPALPAAGEDGGLEVESGLLVSLVRQTAFAVAREASRYALNGVLVNADGAVLTLVATDGRRLALARGELKGRGAKGKVRAIVPVAALSLLAEVVGGREDPVTMVVTENQLSCRAGDALLTTNLIEGQFAPYEDVIPKASDKRLSAARQALLSAVERASLLRNEETKGLRMRFGSEGLVCSSDAPGAGQATVRLRCQYEGPEIEVGFNPVYLLEALRVAPADQVTFEITTPNRPGLLRAGESFLYVLMPVSLD